MCASVNYRPKLNDSNLNIPQNTLCHRPSGTNGKLEIRINFWTPLRFTVQLPHVNYSRKYHFIIIRKIRTEFKMQILNRIIICIIHKKNIIYYFVILMILFFCVDGGTRGFVAKVTNFSDLACGNTMKNISSKTFVI